MVISKDNNDNMEMEKVDKIINEKLYSYLKRKKLNRKTIRLILKNKYSYINKINFANKIKNCLNNVISENEINEFKNLRLKVEILGAKSKRKYLNSTLEKNINRLDKIRHSLSYSFINNEIIIKENNSFLKLVGLNYNVKKYIKSKELLDNYKRWLVQKNYNLDGDESPPIK